MAGPITLLLDLDGVLRLWDQPADPIELSCGLPIGTLHAAAFDPQRLQPAITGAISDAQWRESIIAALRAAYPTAAVEQAVARWSAPVGAVNQPVLELLERCVDVQPVLLSNATDRLDSDLRALGLDQRFARVFNSSALGLAKPDDAVYRHVLRALGVAAQAVLYVDDSASNIAAARALGIVSHRFVDVAAMQAFLSGHAVLAQA